MCTIYIQGRQVVSDNIYVVSSDPALTPGVGSQNIQRGETTSELSKVVCGIYLNMTRSQINDTFLFQSGVKLKVVGEVSEKGN